MTLQEEIADRIVEILMDEPIGRSELPEPFYDSRAKYKAMAQAAVEVVKKRLLSKKTISAAYNAYRLDYKCGVNAYDYDRMSYAICTAWFETSDEPELPVYRQNQRWYAVRIADDGTVTCRDIPELITCVSRKHSPSKNYSIIADALITALRGMTKDGERLPISTCPDPGEIIVEVDLHRRNDIALGE